MGCNRASSDMTPCFVKDGPLALSDDMHCVGCGVLWVEEGETAALRRERETELERLVQLARDCGYATGHADSAEMLLREVLEQCEATRRERDDLRAAVEAFGMDPAKIVAWANKAARGEEAAGEVLERADKAREG